MTDVNMKAFLDSFVLKEVSVGQKMSILKLLILFAMCDGSLHEKEAETIKNFVILNTTFLLEISRRLEEVMEELKSFSFDRTVESILENLSSLSKESRISVFRRIFLLIGADGVEHENEKALFTIISLKRGLQNLV